MTREERLEAALRSVDFAVALSRAAHDHMHRHGLDCPHDIGIVLAQAACAALDAPPAAEEPAARRPCVGARRGASTPRPVTCEESAILRAAILASSTLVDAGRLADPAERGFVGRVYSADGPCTPTNPEDDGDGA